MKTLRFLTPSISLCLAAFWTAIGRTAVSSYSFATFDPPAELGAYASAYGLNNAGTIVGNFVTVDENLDGFVFQAGVFTDVFILSGGVVNSYDYPGALRTILTRINDRGQITGIMVDADLQRHGFVLQNGAAILIGVPGAVNTRTGGLNNRGDIVGYYDDAGFVSHGYLLRDGVFTTLDYPGAFDTVLLDINDRGVIAGTYDGFSRALVASPATGRPGAQLP